MVAVQPRPEYLTDEVRCGSSDREWRSHPELADRLCLLPAGHDGPHIAHRYRVEDHDA